MSASPVVTASAWPDGSAGASITLVQGASVEAVVHAIGGRDAQRLSSYDEALTWFGEGPDRAWVTVGRVGAWVFAWEDVSSRALDDQVRHSLSATGRAVTFAWTEGQLMRFCLNDHGRLVRSIDPEALPTGGATEGTPLPQEAGVDWSTGTRAGLRLLASVTSTPVADPRWRDSPGAVTYGFVVRSGG